MTSRRAVLGTMIAAPLLTLATRGDARDYASAAEVLSEIDRLEAELDQRLSRLAATFSAAAAFAGSVCADHERHRRTRAAEAQSLRAEPLSELFVPVAGE